MAAAACLALGVSVWQLPEDPSTEARGTVAARGATGERLRVTVEAFVGHAAAGTAPPLLEGAVLRPGDGILVRYSNLASERAYLMVFALDERDSVHWIHPAYLSENANPTSLKLAQQATHRILPEVAEPEDAAPGRLRVYALLSRTELDVRGVEGRLAGTKQGVAELFPEAEVEEWRCTWSP